MATIWKYTCGHTTRDECRGPDVEQSLSGLCCECRQSRIGETIAFLRFGAVPETGVSRNHRDHQDEEGVSVYEITRGTAVLVGWHFDFHSRPAFRGMGTIVGWGSDGEPLVAIDRCRRIYGEQLRKILGVHA